MRATSDGVQYGSRSAQCDADHGGNDLRHAIGRAEVKGDRTDRQQREPDRSRDTDRGPQQPGQHSRHAREFERADDTPLDR